MERELIPLEQVPARTGLAEWTVRRRLAALGAPVYAAPEDRRRRLVRAVDVAAMTAPRRVRGEEDGMAA